MATSTFWTLAGIVLGALVLGLRTARSVAWCVVLNMLTRRLLCQLRRSVALLVALVAVLSVVVSGLFLRSAQAAPLHPQVAPPGLVCHVEKPAQTRIADSADRAMLRGLNALRAGGIANTDDALAGFADVVNQTAPSDPRRSAAWDNFGCALLQLASLEGQQETATTSAGGPAPQPTTTVPTTGARNLQLCSAISGFVDNAIQSFAQNGRNRELQHLLETARNTGTMPVSDRPGFRRGAACATLQLQEETYQESGKRVRTPAEAATTTMSVADELEFGQQREIAWLTIGGRMEVIYLHPGLQSDKLTVHLPAGGTYQYTMNVKTFLNGWGEPYDRSRTAYVKAFNGARYDMVYSGRDPSLIGLAPSY